MANRKHNRGYIETSTSLKQTQINSIIEGEMKMENKTTLKESFNKVVIVGIVKENNLELYVKDGKDAIKGNLVIKTGKIEEHTVKCFSYALTKTGADNPSYVSLSKAVGYTSIASLVASGMTEEEATSVATKVEIKGGKIEINDYFNSGKKEVSTYPQFKFSFVETVKGEFKPQATFDIEGVISKMAVEMVDGEITGRNKVTLVAFDFKGNAMPFDFVTTEEAGDYMSTNYELNKTSNVWGELISTVEHIVTKKEGFGSSKENEFDKVNYEMLITSGKQEQYDEDSDKAYNIEAVKKALNAREEMLEKLKSDGGGTAKKGFSQPSNTPAKNATEKKLDW